eukprot:2505382-Rhodomonas_salina.1
MCRKVSTPGYKHHQPLATTATEPGDSSAVSVVQGLSQGPRSSCQDQGCEPVAGMTAHTVVDGFCFSGGCLAQAQRLTRGV